MTVVAARPSRVLVVEDNPGEADLIGEALHAAAPPPIELAYATTLASAHEQLRESRFDSVLLDLQLPDGFGVECVTAIRGVEEDLPIVVLTGLDDDSLGVRCIAAGAQDYLGKQDLNGRQLWRSIEFAVLRRREAAQRRRADELQRLMAAIVESSHDAIVSTSVDGLVTSWNAGAERTFGYRAGEVLGRPLHEVMPGDDAAAAGERRVFVTQRSGGSGAAEEVVRRDRRGRHLTLSVTTSAIKDAEGRTVALAAIMRDLTESRQRDARLKQLTEQEAARGRRMGALLARLRVLQEEERTRMSREVHDGLGQRLSALKMDLRWLHRRLSGDTPAQALLARLDEAEALVDETVLAVQQLALDLRPSALDALGLAAAIRDEARRFEARAGVRTRVTIESGVAPSAAAGTVFFRILQELLSNVARHAQASELHVELFTREGSWHLVVTDNGVGIAPEAMTRASSLGLLGMTERAESQRGSFLLESRPGRGTVATVMLPIRPDPGAAA